MEMDEDRKVVVLVISNIEKNVELFRVHIHEQSIRFDTHFSQGIEGHPELSDDVSELNKLWKNQKIGTDQIFPIMLHLMIKYGDYLRDYYFKEYELDSEGHYVETIDIDYVEEPEEEIKDKSYLHFQYLKKTKKLKKISKKEFEANMVDKETIEFYVDNYVKKGAKFYKREKVDSEGLLSSWYFMVVDEHLKISYIKEFTPTIIN